MGLFVCEKCKCVENTALGHYWSKNHPEWFDWDDSNKEFKGAALCSECGPKYFSDTRESTGYGKWHNKFEKENVEDHLKKYPNCELKNYNNE